MVFIEFSQLRWVWGDSVIHLGGLWKNYSDSQVGFSFVISESSFFTQGHCLKTQNKNQFFR